MDAAVLEGGSNGEAAELQTVLDTIDSLEAGDDQVFAKLNAAAGTNMTSVAHYYELSGGRIVRPRVAPLGRPTSISLKEFPLGGSAMSWFDGVDPDAFDSPQFGRYDDDDRCPNCDVRPGKKHLVWAVSDGSCPTGRFTSVADYNRKMNR